MKKIWTFVAVPRNLAVIVAILSGLGWLIKEVGFPGQTPKSANASVVEQRAVADGAGTAINAAGQAAVGIGSPSSPGQSASSPAGSASQTAYATETGKAINASQGATVQVQPTGK